MIIKRGLLEHVPTQAELERLYHELGCIGAPAVGQLSPWPYGPAGVEPLLALSSEMLRYDPRLLSILLQWIVEHWQGINPLHLRRAMQEMRWPQALLVVFEFAKQATRDRELRYLGDYLAAGVLRINPVERFFMDTERPANRMAQRKAGKNLKAYKRWGFIATERPTVSVTTKQLVGTYDANSRALVRRKLAGRRGSFTLREYLDALDDAISRQQAYQDLVGDSEFELQGRGRSARWRLSTDSLRPCN